MAVPTLQSFIAIVASITSSFQARAMTKKLCCLKVSSSCYACECASGCLGSCRSAHFLTQKVCLSHLCVRIVARVVRDLLSATRLPLPWRPVALRLRLTTGSPFSQSSAPTDAHACKPILNACYGRRIIQCIRAARHNLTEVKQRKHFPREMVPPCPATLCSVARPPLRGWPSRSAHECARVPSETLGQSLCHSPNNSSHGSVVLPVDL